MNIEEAIKHCEEVYEKCLFEGSLECAADHRQLAHWLLELQETLRDLQSAVNRHCTCGGCGPDDPEACPACLVWHDVKGGGE